MFNLEEKNSCAKELYSFDLNEYVYATNINSADYMKVGASLYRIIKDHLGSPRFVVNARTGSIVQRMDYNEWGMVTLDTNPGFQAFGFAGGLYDQDTKLVKFGARDYDGSTGRWLSRDPILFAGGDTNLYGYVMQDPINLIDPDGLSGIGVVRPWPVITPTPTKIPSRSPSIWKKLKYVNDTMDNLLEKEKKACPGSPEFKKIKKDQMKLFDQLLDTLGGGDSLEFLGGAII